MNHKVSRRVLARVTVQKLMAEPTRSSYWMRALAAYLIEHNMAHAAELVLNDIKQELFEQTGQLLVDVTSARELSEAVRSDLAKHLKEKTGARSVILSEEVDASLVGGLIARTPSQELDASVRTQLNQLATIS